MSPTLDERILALAAGQQGVVSRRQLLASGLTERMVDGRVRSGRLVPLHRGIYRTPSIVFGRDTRYALEMAAALACGRGAWLSHRSAAWLWELRPRPADRKPVEVALGTRSVRSRVGIKVRRLHDLTAGETTTRHGIPVTTPERTLRDLCAVVGPADLNRAISRAVRMELIDDDGLAALVRRHRGRPGAPVLRAVVESRRAGQVTLSDAEDVFLDLVTRAQLPEPQVNVLVCGHKVDFFWPAEGLVVEVDGFEFHRLREMFESDRSRDADLAAAGVRAVRVTWRQITRESTATVVKIAQALARADEARRRT